MDATTLLLAAGQLLLAVAIGYIACVVRREAKRSSLVALVTVLNELYERNRKALATVYTLMSSADFKHGDDQLRAGVIDSGDRLRAIQAAITEALLYTLHQCDSEWGFAGRLHEAFRSQLRPGVEKDWEKLVRYSTPS
ncbi:MAG TPA: hypothetical protein VNZ64_12490 [Candidatus Acidoferrum sp.]|jgi:hypothetical protein|nr:hypothetical protein [Candidatus Acidoferrum sp.]